MYTVLTYESVQILLAASRSQESIVEKWCSKGAHSPLEYDDKFQQFTRTIFEVDSMALYKDLGCIRLHMGPLANGVKQHANQWIRIYGDRLQESASQNLVSIQQLLVVSRLAGLMVANFGHRYFFLCCIFLRLSVSVV